MCTTRTTVDHPHASKRSDLRPTDQWVIDTRAPGFAAECTRQSAAATQADASDSVTVAFLDAALAQIDGWQG